MQRPAPQRCRLFLFSPGMFLHLLLPTPMAIKKIIRSSILLTLGNMLPLLASVVLLFPYTSNLETSQYGELAIYISFSALLQILFNYGIDSYVGIHYFEFRDDKTKLKQFVGTIFTVVSILGAILIILFTLGGNVLFHFIFKSRFSFFPYGFMSLITAFCNAFFRIYVNFLFYRQEEKKYFFLNLFNFIITVIVCLTGLWLFPNSLIGPMWGRLLSGLTIFLATLFLVVKEYGFSYKAALVQGLNKFCLPLAGFFILQWIVLYINNYIINAYSTVSDVGIYDFALKCTMLIEVVHTAMLGTMNVRIYNLWNREKTTQSKTEENRYYHVFTMFNVLFIAVNIVVVPVAVKLIVPTESYYASLQFLPVLFAGFIFRGIYNSYYNIVLYQKKTNALPRALLITSIIQIILSVILVKEYSIWGAVLSFTVSKPVQAILMYLESRQLYRFSYNWLKVFVLPILFFIFVFIFEFLPPFKGNIYLPYIEFVTAFLLVIVVFRKDLKDIRLLFAR